MRLTTMVGLGALLVGGMTGAPHAGQLNPQPLPPTESDVRIPVDATFFCSTSNENVAVTGQVHIHTTYVPPNPCQTPGMRCTGSRLELQAQLQGAHATGTNGGNDGYTVVGHLTFEQRDLQPPTEVQHLLPITLVDVDRGVRPTPCNSDIHLNIVLDKLGVIISQASSALPCVFLTECAPGPPIVGATIDSTVRYNDLPGVWVFGDTFMPAWADDGNLYLTSCDTSGWDVKSRSVPGHDFELGVFKGDPNVIGLIAGFSGVHGYDVNTMTAYGITDDVTDGRSWKAAGLTSVGGVLYLSINRHSDSKDPTVPWADNGSILKSSDHGLNWTNHLGQLNTPPPIKASGAMFPGSATPFLEFILYGQDGQAPLVDRAQEFVYAYSTDSLTTSVARLLRVKRTDLPNLQADQWQYYKGGDGNSDANWSSSLGDAGSILSKGGVSGEIIYDAPLRRYVMVQWSGPGLFLYEAPHPWGPWTLVQTWPTLDTRFTSIPNKFISADGKTLWLFYASDYTEDYTYTLWMARLTLAV